MNRRDCLRIIFSLVILSFTVLTATAQMVSGGSDDDNRQAERGKLGLFEAEYEGEFGRQLESKLMKLTGSEYFLVQVDISLYAEQDRDRFGGMTYDNRASLPGLPVSRSTEVDEGSENYFISSMNIQLFYDESIDQEILAEARKWVPYWLPTDNANLEFIPVTFNRELGYADRLKMFFMSLAGVVFALLLLLGLFLLFKMISKTLKSALREGSDMDASLISETEGGVAPTPGSGGGGDQGDGDGAGGAGSSSLSDLAEQLGDAESLDGLSGMMGGGPQKSQARKSKVRPLHEKSFAFLLNLSDEQILSLIRELPPQHIAVVLSSFIPERASALFRMLDSDQQMTIAELLADEDTIQSEELLQLKELLQERLRSRFIEPMEVSRGGEGFFSSLTSHLDLGLLSNLVDNLKDRNPDLARQIRKKLFLFEDTVQLEDNAIRMIIQAIDLKVLALALRDSSLEVKDKFIRNCSDRVQDIIEEELEISVSQPNELAELAQIEVVKLVRNLAEAGRIELPVANELPIQ